MILIAHRGNTNGHNLLENEPSYIDLAISKDFDVEIDDKNWWTAHDIADSLVARFHNEINTGKIKVTVIPDIDSINIGRGVGYDIIEHVPSEEVAAISASKIREKLKNK